LDTEGGGRIAARLASGQSLRLNAGTIVHVLAERAFRLEHGAVYVDSNPTPTQTRSPLTIATPRGVVRDVGTQFEVHVDAAAVRIRVREGSVSLTGDGDALEVAAGQQLDVDEGGRVGRRQLAAFGNEWAWAAEIAPAMTIEGRSLRVFLDGMARERGLALRFVPDGLAAAAATTTLNGSIEGMTLDEALHSVLPTCRMRHRIEGGLLLIEPLAATGDAH
jgi:ferric-dicitrate binding protein FerR (iron transport regulator)